MFWVLKEPSHRAGSFEYRCTHTTYVLVDLQCRLLITSAYSLDPHQAHCNVGPDLDPKVFDGILERHFKKKLNVLKYISIQNYPVFKELVISHCLLAANFVVCW